MKKELKSFFFLLGLFLLFYFMPVEAISFQNAFISGLQLLNEYSREHVLTCLIPAFFIAGAITVFMKRNFVLKYFHSHLL